MNAVIWRAMRGLSVVLLLALGACGGGGSDNTSIKVSPHSLNFSADYASALPAPQAVNVSYSGDGLIFGYPPGSGDTSWLQVVQASGGDPIQFYVVPNTTKLPAGTYSATLRFLTGHADGSNVKVADVAVTYVVSVPFSAASNDIVFQQVDGQVNSVTTQTISITKADGNYSVATDQPWLHAVAHPSNAGGTVDISVDSMGLSHGTYNGVVTVSDNSQGRAPLALSVALVIRSPNLYPDQNTLVLTGVSDQTSLPAKTLSLTSETTREVLFTETTTYAAGTNNWLQSIAGGTTPAASPVGASTTALTPGAYTATLHFMPANGAPEVDIPVTYTLRAAALTLSPGSSLSFLVDANTVTAALSQTLTLGDDGAPMTWTASADASWLKLSRISGDTRSNGGLAVSIPSDQISKLKNGSYSGSVTIRYKSPSVAERVQVIPVSLSVALPEISEVIPAFAATNAGLTHVVRGQGFASIKGQKIHVAGQSLDITVLSDDLARITVPTLTANIYSVSVDNNLGLTRSAGVLTAKNVPQYTAVDLSRNYQANRVLYDEGRQAIYSLDIDLSNPYGSTPTVRRYSYGTGGWQESVVISLQDIFDIALSADGNTMFLAIADKIYSLDLTDPSANIVQIFGLGSNPSSYIISKLSPLADGGMLIVEGIRGSGFTSVFLLDPKTGLKTIGSASCGMTGSSADRTRALLVQQCVSPSQPLQAYNVVLGTLSATSYSTNGAQNQIALDRSGVLQAVDDKVFDQNFNLLASVGVFSSGISFSPDSKRLYSVYTSYDANDYELQVFDTSGNPVAAKYPLLKSYPVPSNIGRTYLNISIDGRTAFLVANAHFMVIPLSN